MFDIGFTELLLVATITLLVVGPERLPEAVRTVSIWIGRFKRSLRETRREIEQQIGADDIRRELHNEEIMRNLEQVRRDVQVGLEDDLEAGGQVRQASIQPPGGAAQSDAAGAAAEQRGAAERASDPRPGQD